MKKIISAALILAMMLTVCGCTAVDPNAAPAEAAQEAPQEAPAAPIGMANPMQEASAQSILSDMGLDLSALEGYENAKFFKINGDPVIAHVSFDKDGESYVYRVATPPAQCDISGMHFEWTTQESVKAGRCDAMAYVSSDGHGYITWYDMAPGILYCLMMDANASVDKLSAMANTLFEPAQGEVSGDFGAEYTALLSELHASYFPGTAGSSITGAVFAAKLADLFTSTSLSEADIAGAAAGYCAALPAEEKSVFFTQFFGVRGSFVSMGLNGTDILSDGGYTPAAEWDQAMLEKMFDLAVGAISDAAYADILEQYCTVISQDWSMEALIENNMNLMLGYVESLDEIGYLITDLDGDGICELLIGAIAEGNDFLEDLIYDLFTVNEFGDAVNVFSSQERSRYYYAGESSFTYHGSSGAADSSDSTQRYSDGVMTVIDSQSAPTVKAELTPFSALH